MAIIRAALIDTFFNILQKFYGQAELVEAYAIFLLVNDNSRAAPITMMDAK